ncbi:hypothetical protein HYX02_03760 [Candidatus Woesearchaeota archaeon]|nr:hypothetical protein [Candidatus Woesearchaeota archaeon]
MEKIREKEFKTRKKNVLGRIFSHKLTNFTSLIFILAAALIFMPLANAATVRIQNGVLNISNNLLVSTNALFVDAANNKVGIGTTSPGIATTGSPAFTVLGSSETLIEVGRSAPISDGLRLGQYDFISTAQNPGNEQVGAIIGELQGNHPGVKGGRILLQTRADGGGMTNRMTIDNAGNVGIGTLSPESTLDVRGAVKATSFAGDGSQLTNLPTATGSSNSLWNSTGNNIYQSELKGNVGIGTASPDTLLHLASSTNAMQILETANVANAGGMNFRRARGSLASKSAVQNADEIVNLQFQAYDGTAYRNAGVIGAIVDGTPGSSDMPGALLFLTTPDNSGAASERMRIDSKGNIGIGTTNPQTKLDITGTLRASSTITSSALTQGSVIFSGANGALSQDNTNLYWDNTNKILSLGTTTPTDVTNDAKVIVIDAGSGRASFNIAGSAGGEGEVFGMMVFNNKNSDAATLFRTASIQAIQPSTDADESEVQFAVHSATAGGAGNVQAMRIDKRGYVGIGDTTPDAMLDVAGEMRADGVALDGSGKVVCIKSNGDFGTCSSVAASDGTCTCG